MELSRNRSSGGFTYIEAMLIISITVVLSTMMLTVYGQFRGRQKLRSETLNFIEVLELTREKASGNKKACGEYDGTYSVFWTTSGYSVTPGGCDEELSYALPETITIDAGGTATYKSIGLQTSPECLVLTDSQTSQCRKVNIDLATTIEQIEADCSCP